MINEQPSRPGHGLFAAHSDLQERIEQLLQPHTAPDLPPSYLKRYIERVGKIRSEIDGEIRAKLDEIARKVERQISDYRHLLTAELRAERKERRVPPDAK